MNTMYAAVARRSREIGTLRVLGFSQGQHPVQLLPGIGAAVGAGRRAGMPAGAAAERRHHGDRQLQLSPKRRFDFHVTPRNHAGRHRLRGGAGRRRRTVPGAQGGAERDPDGAAGGLDRTAYGCGTEESANRPQQAALAGAFEMGHALDRWRRIACCCALGAWRVRGAEAERGARGGSAARHAPSAPPARPTAWCSTPPATSWPRTRSNWPPR